MSGTDGATKRTDYDTDILTWSKHQAALSAILRPAALATGAVIMLAAGCAHWPTNPVAAPPRAAARVQPPDWFHQQLAAARAAKQAHQPKADTVGAQLAYDDVMRTACARAAVAGPSKYPARCDAILHPPSAQSPIGPCDANDPAAETECND